MNNTSATIPTPKVKRPLPGVVYLLLGIGILLKRWASALWFCRREIALVVFFIMHFLGPPIITGDPRNVELGFVLLFCDAAIAAIVLSLLTLYRAVKTTLTEVTKEAKEKHLSNS